jgi:hypothetical protein
VPVFLGGAGTGMLAIDVDAFLSLSLAKYWLQIDNYR